MKNIENEIINSKEYFSVFISDSGKLKIEETNPFECLYYIYTNTKEKCEKFVEKYKDKFSNYDEFYSFLKGWCKENNIDYRGCSTKFSQMAI